MSTQSLWIVRHAQPLVAAGVCYGRTDMAADPQATLSAARRLVAALSLQSVRTVQIVSSPLQRCTQLANAVQQLTPAWTVTVDARLAEMDFGAWEGQLWAEIDPAELQAWTADFADYRAGGQGESVRVFMNRVNAALTAWRDAARGRGNQALLWVTHAGVERAVRLLQAGVDCPLQANQWPRQGLGLGAWSSAAVEIPQDLTVT